ncbi:MAG: type 1 glutamine amidotransferase [Rhodothermales bacterium]|nr:type 1 glutamine amidotransferase [Rhodothermales bacterium]
MIRILLLQARSTADMEIQELECFVERTRLSEDNFVRMNVARGGLHDDPLAGMDAFMIGGAGEFSAVPGTDYAWMDPVLELIREAVDARMPVFGSCWGHQLIARALGGDVVHDPDLAELGCHRIILTEEGRRDPLLKSFPTSFLANMGHHDRVARLPDLAIDLAHSETQPHEAFRMVDLPVYGTQFHSELDAHRERERLIRYRPWYMDQLGAPDEFERVLDSLAETTEVDHLLADFVEMYV